MPKARVLIVDNSAVIRRALTGALARESRLEVVGSAPNGRTALMKIPLLRPDVVVLDLEMPERDGLETLAAIRRLYPRLPVIMLTAPTSAGVAATIDALTHGANDYVTKPEGAVPSDQALKIASDHLVLKVALCCPDTLTDGRAGPTVRSVSPRARRGRDVGPCPPSRVDVVVIGVSTGGPGALMDLIPSFPADFPVPILIVQHMPPMFTRLLAERLSAKAHLPVAEGQPGLTLSPGRIWIAPGDFHLAVERDGDGVRLVTHRNPPENSCRPSADVLFRSVARVYRSQKLAVVMTGMGQDGFRGCRQIHATGGQVLAQDEASSVVWGMPGIVARSGMADQIVPLNRLSAEILDRVWYQRASAGAGATPSRLAP